MDFFRAFKAPSKFAQDYLFFTDGLGHLKSEDFIIDREDFNNNLVMYVLSGKLHVEQNGHHILQKGEGIMMRLLDKHKYYTDKVDTCEILWLHFSGRQTELYLKYLDQTHGLPVIFREDRVAELIRHCFTLFAQGSSQYEFLVSEAIYGIILSTINAVCSEKKEVQQPNKRTEFINKAMGYVDQNIYNRFSLEAFAKHFNMSRYYFCKLFDKVFQMSPMQFVLMKKVEISKYMLTYTHDSISTIAQSLGFVDQSHFSRTFKRFVKQSPLVYRRKGF